MKSKFEMRSELIEKLAGTNPQLTALTMGNFERMTFTDNADFDRYLKGFDEAPKAKPATDADIEEIVNNIM